MSRDERGVSGNRSTDQVCQRPVIDPRHLFGQYWRYCMGTETKGCDNGTSTSGSLSASVSLCWASEQHVCCLPDNTDTSRNVTWRDLN